MFFDLYNQSILFVFKLLIVNFFDIILLAVKKRFLYGSHSRNRGLYEVSILLL